MVDHDWFDVDRLGDGWWRITEGEPVLRCDTFVIHDDDDAVLIDTGLGIGDCPSVVKRIAGADVPVILTHSHWDHIGGASQFKNVFIHDRERGADGRVAIDGLSDEFRKRPSQFVRDWQDCGLEFPDSFDPESYEIEPTESVEAITPGETIDVGGRAIETVPIPGHSPGQLAILDRTARICHGADVLEPGYKVFAHFQDSDLEAYYETIERLIGLRDEGAFETLTITHGEPLTGSDLTILDEARAVIGRILDGDAQYEHTETCWGTVRRYTAGEITVLHT